MELRKSFDTVTDKFDRRRPRYCREAFDEIIRTAELHPGKSVLEIGPGTGQATEPILRTGCDYLAVELGSNMTDRMKNNFGKYGNFNIINDDFITCDLPSESYDLDYSAATTQWIPEETAFAKCYDILKPGGILAMMFIKSDYRAPNEELYGKIQSIYDRYFHPPISYSQKFTYSNAIYYGFSDLRCLEYHSQRVLTADEYVELCETHCDHIVLEAPYRNPFFSGIKNAVLDARNRIVLNDTVVLYTVKKTVTEESYDKT